MSQITESTAHFLNASQHILSGMFGGDFKSDGKISESTSLDTDKQFIISVFYTGTVYGEYMLAMDEATAAAIIGVDSKTFEDRRQELRQTISDAFSEALNMIVGESILDLSEVFKKLTFTTPRMHFGDIHYPSITSGRGSMQSAAGTIECHFYLDSMRLDLA